MDVSGWISKIYTKKKRSWLGKQPLVSDIVHVLDERIRDERIWRSESVHGGARASGVGTNVVDGRWRDSVWGGDGLEWRTIRVDGVPMCAAIVVGGGGMLLVCLIR